MMKYGINYGPAARKIFAGRLNKANTMMLDDKEDVTLHAIEAVGRYVMENHAGSGALEVGDKVLVIEARYEDKPDATRR
jgi:hypothetical protein